MDKLTNSLTNSQSHVWRQARCLKSISKLNTFDLSLVAISKLFCPFFFTRAIPRGARAPKKYNKSSWELLGTFKILLRLVQSFSMIIEVTLFYIGKIYLTIIKEIWNKFKCNKKKKIKIKKNKKINILGPNKIMGSQIFWAQKNFGWKNIL